MSDLRHTPLTERHEALGARLVPFAGFAMPIQYEGTIKEHHAVREGAGLFDVSHMGELFVRGQKAVELVDSLVTGAASKLELGRAMYTLACNERGTILDDLIVYRIGEEEVMIICNASNRAKIASHVAKHAEGVCDFVDESDDFALIALQGPKAFEVLSAVDAGSLESLKSFATREAKIGGIDCRVARTGYTGEDGVEVVVRNENALALWDKLLEAGAKPIGLGARDTLRLEARLSLYGNEITEETHPFEAGLSWVVKMDHGDFIGRDALAKIKEEGWGRKLVGFEMNDRNIARHDYPILRVEDANGAAFEGQNEPVGVVTSGSPSPTLGKNIGLGYVPKDHAKIGRRLAIDIRGKKVGQATIVKTPFYKRA